MPGSPQPSPAMDASHSYVFRARRRSIRYVVDPESHDMHSVLICAEADCDSLVVIAQGPAPGGCDVRE